MARSGNHSRRAERRAGHRPAVRAHDKQHEIQSPVSRDVTKDSRSKISANRLAARAQPICTISTLWKAPRPLAERQAQETTADSR